MKKEQRANLTALAVASVFVIALCVLAYCDPRYIPVEQGGLQAVATAGVGWVVWRFQVKSQKNAIMLEHYKEQSKMLAAVAQHANPLINNLRDDEKYQKDAKAMYELLDKGDIWLPDEVIKLAYQLVNTIRRVHESSSNLEEFNLSKEAHSIFQQLKNACRKHLHSEALTEATAKIVSDANPVKAPETKAEAK